MRHDPDVVSEREGGRCLAEARSKGSLGPVLQPKRKADASCDLPRLTHHTGLVGTDRPKSPSPPPSSHDSGPARPSFSPQPSERRRAQTSPVRNTSSRLAVPMTHLSLEVCLPLDLPLLLQPVNNILVSPTNFRADPLERTVLPPRFQPQNSERSRDDHLLDLILSRGYTLV
jgi:hypothetical protein